MNTQKTISQFFLGEIGVNKSIKVCSVKICVIMDSEILFDGILFYKQTLMHFTEIKLLVLIMGEGNKIIRGVFEVSYGKGK